MTHTIPTPVGPVRLTADARGLTGVFLADHPPDEPGKSPVLAEAARQLAEYFAGDRRSFDLPLALDGTPFQQAVWAELCRIPFGEAISYAELARRVGRPGASRAVGSANGRNRHALVVPCHRVIAADGTLGGYGGGPDRKEWLLRHEGVTVCV
jgi:methylated-DNA-[protein]-cysteine S-methyltransferase